MPGFPPPGVHLTPLLAAIAAVETASGRNNWPRIEKSFLPRGERFTIQGHIIEGSGTNFSMVAKERFRRWGIASAASWGPWQILYHTAADRGYIGAPHLLHDAAASMPWVLRNLERIVAGGAITVAQIADAWNSGTHRDHIVPLHYMNMVQLEYEQQERSGDAQTKYNRGV